MLANILSIFPNDARAQKIFDIIFGIIAPILCLIFDPGIIRSLNDPCLAPTPSVVNRYAMFLYVAIMFGMLMLLIWLFANETFQDTVPFFAGVFMIDTACALGLGIYMLPLSLVGSILMGLGLLGFIPFLTTLVYLRNCIDAIRKTMALPDKLFFKLGFILLGIFITFTIPALMQYRFPIMVPTFTHSCP